MKSNHCGKREYSPLNFFSSIEISLWTAPRPIDLEEIGQERYKYRRVAVRSQRMTLCARRGGSYATRYTNMSCVDKFMTKAAPKRYITSNTPTTTAIFCRPRLARNRINTGARTSPRASNAAQILESTSNDIGDKWTALAFSGISLVLSSWLPSHP